MMIVIVVMTAIIGEGGPGRRGGPHGFKMCVAIVIIDSMIVIVIDSMFMISISISIRIMY